MGLTKVTRGVIEPFENYDVNATGYDGNTLLHHYSRSPHRLESIIYLLQKEQGANPNFVNDKGETPLHLATKYRNTWGILELLKRGANIHAVDANGNTPLVIAAKNRNPSDAYILLKNGAAGCY